MMDSRIFTTVCRVYIYIHMSDINFLRNVGEVRDGMFIWGDYECISDLLVLGAKTKVGQNKK